MLLHKYPPRLWEALKLKQGIYARLPQHYLRSLQETRPPAAVHWQPLGVKFRLNPRTGQRERVQDVPIPIYHPPESQRGLWGGEGWITGYRYANNDKLSTRLKKCWKPQLFNRELYSEILDHKFKITVTARTLDLIDKAYGFDFYILKNLGPKTLLALLGKYKVAVPVSGDPTDPEKTSKEDLNSKLGMDLKRAMLLRLAHKDTELYPDDPERRERVYTKYKEFVIPEEEADWVGLSLEEAVEKQRLLEQKDPVPLFKTCVEELVQELACQKLAEPEVVEKKT